MKNSESHQMPPSESQQLTPSPDVRMGKFNARYWRNRIYRPIYTDEDGTKHQVQGWWIRPYHAGRRQAFALGTNNADEAAGRALRIFKMLKTEGWEATLRKFKPDADRPDANTLTVGDFLKAVETAGGTRHRTFANYSYALRRIAADIAGGTRHRFNPAAPVWSKPDDAVSLSALTGEAVNRWRIGFVAKAGREALDQQRAKRTANSYIRNARALFTEESLARLPFKLSKPLPFDGVRLERNVGSTRYVSTFNASELVAQAREELREKDPDAYMAILLALVAGLRRAEIDALQYQQIDFAQGLIRVMPLRHALKTESSEGVVFVDPALLSELAAIRATRPPASLYVVAPEVEARPTRAAQYYRSQKALARATAWLRRHGVNGRTPLHQCRKEFGSILAQRADINVASRMLRHSNLGTTAAYYVDARRTAVVPLGDMLNHTNPATTPAANPATE